MIVNMSEKATQQEIEHVIERIRASARRATSLTSRVGPSALLWRSLEAGGATRSRRCR